jgi:Hemopexin
MATKFYFFRGNQYLRYDLATDRVDAGYPLPITGNWPGFKEAGFVSDVRAAVNWG